MLKKIKVKSIILNDKKEIPVEQFYDDDDGIKLYLTDELHGALDLLTAYREFVHLDKIKIRTDTDEIWTLFDCCYILRKKDRQYIHLYYYSFVENDVDSRNFLCNKLSAEFEISKSLINRIFSENIDFIVDDIRIKHDVDDDNCTIIISSTSVKTYDELFGYFIIYLELLNFIFGYFPKIKAITYFLDDNKIILNEELADKYISADKYTHRDECFVCNIDNNTFKNAFIKYKLFSKKVELQINMYFIATMRKNSYIEIDIVNILQILDGIYDQLSIFENQTEDYCVEMNIDIINKIKDMDFSVINEKYGSDININERIVKSIERMYKINYGKKLKNMFKFDSYFVFKEEKKGQKPFIKYGKLIGKCVNSRNKISHVVSIDECFNAMENAVYIYKFILIFRLLILQEIDLSNNINKSILNGHILLINNYIKSNLSK